MKFNNNHFQKLADVFAERFANALHEVGLDCKKKYTIIFSDRLTGNICEEICEDINYASEDFAINSVKLGLLDKDGIDINKNDNINIGLRFQLSDNSDIYIDISNLLDINFYKYDYTVEITNISDEINVDYIIEEAESYYIINVAFDIVVISNNSTNLKIGGIVYGTALPHVAFDPKPEKYSDVVDMIVKSKIYGINVIVTKRDQNKSDTSQ